MTFSRAQPPSAPDLRSDRAPWHKGECEMFPHTGPGLTRDRGPSPADSSAAVSDAASVLQTFKTVFRPIARLLIARTLGVDPDAFRLELPPAP